MKASHLFLFSLALTALGLAASAPAQERHTPNTLAFDERAERPAARLVDIAWLEGHWRGEALGGLSEEIWSAPRGGAMMGMYRLVRGDSTIFYELLTLVEEAGSLTLKLKHFNADLTGWEEQNEVRSFSLVKRTLEAMYFDGMTFEVLDRNRIQVFLAIRMQDGSIREEKFAYERMGR